ncbi:hypothetical protein K458DRAFT_464826 [Lentithecium fluviatile CBS 122367]|uniref:Uncharacterized protein n=1 Tax=Lentithecium fluviatile CBS 122367 TaxID=1168545 RepID=A0A6G1JCW4_9PLEO|nr:hypothetical protein K458DRAFT_464826 [Lentithecium fluviatile CBS 122367]
MTRRSDILSRFERVGAWIGMSCAVRLGKRALYSHARYRSCALLFNIASLWARQRYHNSLSLSETYSQFALEKSNTTVLAYTTSKLARSNWQTVGRKPPPDLARNEEELIEMACLYDGSQWVKNYLYHGYIGLSFNGVSFIEATAARLLTQPTGKIPFSSTQTMLSPRSRYFLTLRRHLQDELDIVPGEDFPTHKKTPLVNEIMLLLRRNHDLVKSPQIRDVHFCSTSSQKEGVVIYGVNLVVRAAVYVEGEMAESQRDVLWGLKAAVEHRISDLNASMEVATIPWNDLLQYPLDEDASPSSEGHTPSLTGEPGEIRGGEGEDSLRDTPPDAADSLTGRRVLSRRSMHTLVKVKRSVSGLFSRKKSASKI